MPNVRSVMNLPGRSPNFMGSHGDSHGIFMEIFSWDIHGDSYGIFMGILIGSITIYSQKVRLDSSIFAGDDHTTFIIGNYNSQYKETHCSVDD